MIVTPTELQLIGGGLVFATALGSYWFFKRRSDRAAANINKTDQNSDKFDKIMEELTEENVRTARSERRRGSQYEQRREKQRPQPGTNPKAEALRREPLERFGAAPKPRVSPEQATANRVRDEQEEELRRRRRQNDEDSNLLTTMAVIQSIDDAPASRGRSDSPGYGSSNFSDSGSSSRSSGSWGGDCGSSSSSSSDSSSSSSDSGSCSSSD
ncbi:hypothetical protein hairong_058 [Pseudomonas phage hairong]|nr:hypothetical protein hairong_058 [Pseudomonas phage hairong]